MKKTTMVKIALVVEIVVLLLIIMVKKSCNRQEVFYAEDFGFTDLVSSTDKDADGIDDFKDMMLAARTYVETNPPYKSEYYEGGYPTDGWENEMQYVAPGSEGRPYDLFSLGADGQQGGEGQDADIYAQL